MRRLPATGAARLLRQFSSPWPWALLLLAMRYRLLVPADRTAVEVTQAYWGGFARNGHPGTAGGTTWAAFDPALESYLDLDASPVMGADLRAAECDLIDAIPGASVGEE